MWCPSCRQFTPKLARFYKTLKESGKNLEIVLVSRDREDEDLKEYLTEHCGGWLAIPFGDERIQRNGPTSDQVELFDEWQEKLKG
ncbi:hypothetical protein OSTOST_07400 [Ostertagia ostertagi]